MQSDLEIIAAGLMSGSSLDGIDYAVIRFHPNCFRPSKNDSSNKKFEWIYTCSHPYPDSLKSKLRNSEHLAPKDYFSLQAEYSLFLGKLVSDLNNNISLEDQPKVIGIHGHTVFHDPQAGYSVQMGDGAILAFQSEKPVCIDFRNAHIAAGGQGAPMAPAVESLLTDEYGFFLNLGGIANLSVFSTEGIVAFDICPCNQLLNFFAEKAGLDYDSDGSLAEKGKVSKSYFRALLNHPYLQKSAPKSLSNQETTKWFKEADEVLKLPPEDGLRTSCEFIAYAIKEAATNFAGAVEKKRVLVSGGGAHNGFLISLIGEKLRESGLEIYCEDNQMTNFKESLLMGYMAAMRWKSLPGFPLHQTPSMEKVMAGALYLPPKIKSYE